MENLIIIIVLAVIIVIGAKSTMKHMKGEGGCCGGGSKEIREHKKLDGTKIGEKEVEVRGMHCENCEARVERFVNKLDGAVCKANYKKNLAIVTFSKPIDDEQIKKEIETAGYEVGAIRNRC